MERNKDFLWRQAVLTLPRVHCEENPQETPLLRWGVCKKEEGSHTIAHVCLALTC